MGATGSAVLDFGAAPGSAGASVAVTGQAAILSTSKADAWVSPAAATADHTEEEHRLEGIKMGAASVVAGTGFTIHGECLQGRTYGQFNVNWVWA